MLNRLHHLLLGLSGSLLVLALEGIVAATPGFAAEQITFKYGPFARSVPVASLREYAETDKASPDLAALLGFVKAKDRDALQQGLKIKLPVDVVTVDRLLRSPAGETLLSKGSQAIVHPGGAGVQALRGGLVVAAASKEGLGVLSFLEAYPDPNMTINLPVALKLAKSDGLGGLLGTFLKQ